MLIWLLNALNGRDELKKQTIQVLLLLHIHKLKRSGKSRAAACKGCCLMNLILRAHKKEEIALNRNIQNVPDFMQTHFIKQEDIDFSKTGSNVNLHCMSMHMSV